MLRRTSIVTGSPFAIAAAAVRRWCPASRGWAGSGRGRSRAAPRSGFPRPWPPRPRGPAARARSPTPAAGLPASRGSKVASTVAPTRLRHGGGAEVEHVRTHLADATRAPWAGCRGGRPAAGPRGAGPRRESSARRRRRPRGGAPAPGRCRAAGSRRRAAPGARLVRAPHVRRGEDDRAPRRPVASRPGRGTRARRAVRGQRRARRWPRRRARARTGVADACRRRRAGEQGVGEQRARRRPAGDRHRTGRPRVTVHGAASSTTARAPASATPASAGSSSTPSAGQAMAAGTGVPSGLGEDRRPRRRRPAGRGRRAARGPARRGRRRRRAVRRRSRPARRPPAGPARCPRPRRRCRAPPRSGPTPRSPAASPQRSRRGRGRSARQWPPPDWRTRGRALGERGDQPAEATVRGERAGEGVVGEQRLLPGHGRQPVRRVGERVEHGQVGGRRPVRRDRGGARRLPAGQHRQQQAGGGQAGRRSPSRGAAVDVDEELVHAGPVQREAVGSPRSGTVSVTGIGPPGARVPGSGVNAGVAASARPSPASASRTSPSVRSASPRCSRTSRSPTRRSPLLRSVPVTVSVRGPVGGDHARRRSCSSEADAARTAAGPPRRAPDGRSSRRDREHGASSRWRHHERPRPSGRDRPLDARCPPAARWPAGPAAARRRRPAGDSSSSSGTQATSVDLDVVVGELAADARAAGSGAPSCARGGPRRRTRSRWCRAARPRAR